MKRIPLSLYLYTILCALIVSCAQLGFVKPVTTEDKIYTAYSGVGSSYKTIADLAERKQITRDKGLHLIDRVDSAKELIDNAAMLLINNQPGNAEQSLQFALTILKAIEAELKEKGTGT